MLNALSEEQSKDLARYLSYPRGVTPRDRNGYNTYLRARRVNQLMREVGKNNLDLIGMDLANVKNWYAANLKNNAGRYLKTSSLIITYNDLLTTGGHNISSRISRVNSMTNYKRNRSYTQTDYKRPAATEPVATKETPKTTKATHTAKNNSHNQTLKQSGNKPAVRSRSAVISTTPRKTRGL